AAVMRFRKVKEEIIELKDDRLLQRPRGGENLVVCLHLAAKVTLQHDHVSLLHSLKMESPAVEAVDYLPTKVFRRAENAQHGAGGFALDGKDRDALDPPLIGAQRGNLV